MTSESKESSKAGSLFGPPKIEEKKTTVLSTAPISGFGVSVFSKPQAYPADAPKTEGQET